MAPRTSELTVLGPPFLASSLGKPKYLWSDIGSEFTAKAVRTWLSTLGITTLLIARGSPRENGYVESFIGRLCDEFLKGEVFDTIAEAQVLIERMRSAYNRVRPHSSLGYG